MARDPTSTLRYATGMTRPIQFTIAARCFGDAEKVEGEELKRLGGADDKEGKVTGGPASAKQMGRVFKIWALNQVADRKLVCERNYLWWTVICRANKKYLPSQKRKNTLLKCLLRHSPASRSGTNARLAAAAP